ncbi:MAG: tetratricopeptide repeat protein, partial [Chitinophagales bacterium]|nr:tetratricopeptide repeat protein [Chitinophagales bacterium]MDW8420217.1 tetratricopeptide repeat protein [Chitinophagales bacterium]
MVIYTRASIAHAFYDKMKKVTYIIGALLLLPVLVNAAPAPGKEKKKKKKDEPAAVRSVNVARVEQMLLDAEKAKITEDWDAAIRGYQDILKEDPANGNAHFQLAQIYQNQMRWADAEAAALAAVKADETNKWYLELLAGIYANQGKGKEAVETYKLLIQRFPNNPDYYLQLGFLQSRLVQYEQAIKTYDLFEKNFGLDEQVIEEKKNLYLRLNRFQDAVNEVKKLQEAFPG